MIRLEEDKKIAEEQAVIRRMMNEELEERKQKEQELTKAAAEEAQKLLLIELKQLEERKTEESKSQLCQICQEPLFDAEGSPVIALSVCPDIYHTECIQPWLKTCIDNSQLPILCPEPKCKRAIPLPDLRELLSYEELQRLQKFEWKNVRDQNPDMLECPTEDCDYLFYKEAENQTYHHCPSCGITYCLQCEMLYHVEYTCEEVQEEKKQAAIQKKADDINNNEQPEDKMLEDWALASGSKKCGKCNYWVQKSEGCNHMTCRCGYEFCYVCGGKYRACACNQ